MIDVDEDYVIRCDVCDLTMHRTVPVLFYCSTIIVPYHSTPYHTTVPYHCTVPPYRTTVPYHRTVPPYRTTVPYHRSTCTTVPYQLLIVHISHKSGLAGYMVHRYIGTGCRVQGTGYRYRGTGYRVQGTAYRVWGTGYGVRST